MLFAPDRGPLARPQVRILDTTLRDGEQSPGATLTSKEKLKIAHQLAKLGEGQAAWVGACKGGVVFEAVQLCRPGPITPGIKTTNTSLFNNLNQHLHFLRVFAAACTVQQG